MRRAVSTPGERTDKAQTKPKRDHHVVGNSGLYWTCYNLSRLGWNVMPTARNARGIDIIAYNRDCTKTIAVQVKSLSKRSPVPLGQTLGNIRGDWWVIIVDVHTKPEAFILKPKQVKDAAHRGEKEGRVSYWLQTSSYMLEKYRERWNRIGSAH